MLTSAAPYGTLERVTLGAVERVLLATKLRPPVPHGLVPRPALIGRLRPTEYRLTLLDAPAGWGKTSLIAQWAEQETDRVAWLGLDRGDDDPVLFWSYLLAAVRTVAPAIGDTAVAAVAAGQHALRDAVLPSLVNDLLAEPEPIVLVLDDYHLISDPQIHDTIALLLDRMPPALHLVVCARGECGLPVSRLRASNALQDVRADELALGEDEVERALADIPGLRLTLSAIGQLTRRIEGWPAGVALARASLAVRPATAAEFVGAFTGTDRFVLDYLASEVLAGLPADQRTFLLRTSILNKLTPPLCSAVSGRSDAAALLDQLERAGVFVSALDTGRQWFRYHRLFGELLRHELTLAEPTHITELHRRAAAWFQDNGALTDAVEHHVAAGNTDAAADLVAAHWNDWFNRGRLGAVTAWLDQLPPSRVRTDHRLCAARAWLALDRGQLDSVDPWLTAADAAIADDGPDDGPEPPDLAALRDLAVLRCVHRFKIGNVGASRTAALRVLELGGSQASFATTVAQLMIGITAHWSGNPQSARRPLAEAVRHARQTDNQLAEAYALGYLALGALDMGAREDAARAVHAALEAADQPEVAEHFVAALPHLAAAVQHATTGHGDAAAHHAERALALARRGAGRLEIAATLGVWAQAGAAIGRDTQPELEQARALARSCADPGTVTTRLSQIRLPRPDPTSNGRTPKTTDLSQRERDLLPLLAGPLSQRDIGSVLHLSLNTVKTHSRVLFRKLGVSSRAEAVARARELGLL